MRERSEDLDLLADHIMSKMASLLGGAIQDSVPRSIALRWIDAVTGDTDSYSADQSTYASSLLNDVANHMAARWNRFRDTEKRTCSPAVRFEDQDDFEP